MSPSCSAIRRLSLLYLLKSFVGFLLRSSLTSKAGKKKKRCDPSFGGYEDTCEAELRVPAAGPRKALAFSSIAQTSVACTQQFAKLGGFILLRLCIPSSKFALEFLQAQ